MLIDVYLERNFIFMQDRLAKLKNSSSRSDAENADLKERLRAAEQRMSLVDESKNRIEVDLNSVKKSLSEKQLEIEVIISNHCCLVAKYIYKFD